MEKMRILFVRLLLALMGTQLTFVIGVEIAQMKNSVNADHIHDLKLFCLRKVKKNFCSEQNINYALKFQLENEKLRKIIIDKEQERMLDKERQIKLALKLQREKFKQQKHEKQLKEAILKSKMKILNEFTEYFRIRNF